MQLRNFEEKSESTIWDLLCFLTKTITDYRLKEPTSQKIKKEKCKILNLLVAFV